MPNGSVLIALPDSSRYLGTSRTQSAIAPNRHVRAVRICMHMHTYVCGYVCMRVILFKT